ncbi:MAG: hydrolase 1, exosortase A system-associated, partial [Alphaproteobacteria bacterium]|nr:hydrolase 1, exosortase A system-associated [Alphaproteobacteria bacterium]
PREVMRLLGGGVNLRKLAHGLARAARPAPGASDLASRMRKGLERFDGNVSILLASSDRTAQVFDAVWPKDDPRVSHCEGAGHAFAEPHARDWLEARLVEVLRASP